MRNPEDLSTEDRQRVEEYTRTGIHSVERKPFRPWLMMLMLLVVVTLLSVIAVVLEKLYDTTLGRDVALKLMLDVLSNDPERLARFEREARTLAALNHPGIVHVYSIEDSAGARYIAMERVYGRTLAERIEAGGLPLPQLLDLAIPLADALAAAHARGVIHRDLKPANVMVTDDGYVKVLDFGLARASRREADVSAETMIDPTPASTETGGSVVGTAAYLSPEQARGGPATGASDVFALGLVCYELATGQHPMRAAGYRLDHALRGDGYLSHKCCTLVPGFPPEVDACIMALLARKPEERTATAAQAHLAPGPWSALERKWEFS